MNSNANQYLDIIDFIVSAANLANVWRLNTSGTHMDTVSNEDTEVTTEYYGDPTRMDKGIPTARHKIVSVRDNYIGYINSICDLCGILGPGGTVSRYEDTIYEYDFKELIAIPEREVTTVSTAILQIPNMDSSLGNNRDPNPNKYRYPLIDTAKNALALSIHMISAYILINFSFEAISIFVSLADPKFAWNQFKDKMEKLNDPITDDVLTFINERKRLTNLYEKCRKKLQDQLHSAMDQQSLAWLAADGDFSSEIADDVALQQNIARYNIAKNMVLSISSGVYYGKVQTNVTTYNVCGAGTLITNSTWSLTANGTMLRTRYTTKAVVSEQIIKHIRLIKRTLKFPTSHMGSVVYQFGREKSNTIQISSTNWNSVRHVFYGAATIVSQVSDTYSFMTNDYQDAKALFHYFKNFTGVKTVRINYSFLTGQGTATVSNIVAV